MLGEALTSKAKRDLFPGALELMILRSLQRLPSHGYALVQHIRLVSKDALRIEEGSLYPALQRLLREGLVKAEWSVSATGRRIRRYRLTPAGARHLERAASDFEEMISAVMRVLAPGTP